MPGREEGSLKKAVMLIEAMHLYKLFQPLRCAQGDIVGDLRLPPVHKPAGE